MTAFEWIAIVGAAAWLPHLLMLGYRVLVKPTVVVIPIRKLEIGYNFFGPILNMRAALLARRKDAVIVEMAVHLRHEKGRTIRLVWQSFAETFSEFRTEQGERAEFTRDQTATALKVPTAFPTEKFIRFQDPTFLQANSELMAEADATLSRVKEATGPIETFLSSREFDSFLSHFRSNFCWEVGRYNVYLEIKLLDVRKPIMWSSGFELSEKEVENLRRNVPLIEQRATQIAKDIPEEERVSPIHWATPSLVHKELVSSKREAWMADGNSA